MLSNNSKKVLIMAGGTGGHIFPAMSIAEKLLQRGALVEWLGSNGGLEKEIVNKTSIPIHLIAAKGVRGGGFFSLLKAPFMIAKATWQALRIIRNVNPDCVLGMGGFVTGPGGVAAKLKGKKLIIHEQNAVPGATNKILAIVADRVLEAFPETFTNRRKVTVTGNPIRDAVLNVSKTRVTQLQDDRALHILVIGGSQGAQGINQAVVKMLSQWKAGQIPEIVHQVGQRNLDAMLASYREHGLEEGPGLRIMGFLDDIAEYFSWADLVIGRSGASTVCELAVAGLPAILVPYPYHKDNQQLENAKWLAAAGAAIIIEQSQLSSGQLGELLFELSEDREKLSAMSSAALELGQPGASEKIAEICLEPEHA